MITARKFSSPALQLSSLTTDPVLSRIFRRLEDDGAVEVLPNFSPRPTSGAAAGVREAVDA